MDKPDLEVNAMMSIGGKLIAAYNQAGEPLYIAPEWALENGELVQVSPMKFTDCISKLD